MEKNIKVASSKKILPKPNRRLKKALKEAKKIASGKIKAIGYHNVHEMFEDILNED